MRSPIAIVVGLGYGDEGKGAVVDHLTRERGARTVVRFSGGAQAAHNVVLRDGTHHTFAQFGAGTFAGADTYLAPGMMVNPFNMLREYAHLTELGYGDCWRGLTVHQNCLVTTPIHRAANRLREDLREDGRHGTCGQGIGETRWFARRYPSDALRVRDLRSRLSVVLPKLKRLLDAYEIEFGPAWLDVDWEQEGGLDTMSTGLCDWRDSLQRVVGDGHMYGLLLENQPIIFEGSQGLMIDETYGTAPFNTWSDVTPRPALNMLANAGRDLLTVDVVGVIRSYSTRHGAGPFPPENFELDLPPELHNHGNGLQGAWRTGPFDLKAFAYACSIVRPTELALTHTDAVPGNWPCIIDADRFAERRVVEFPMDEALLAIEGSAGAPVRILGSGPSEYSSKVLVA